MYIYFLLILSHNHTEKFYCKYLMNFFDEIYNYKELTNDMSLKFSLKTLLSDDSTYIPGYSRVQPTKRL